ncbi:subtilisin-like protease 1, putative [Babesia caballi]|uniref:subtilisin n=1 Tax=Babesia caballi TaxID=5871 RepID=A0AAV4LVV5_BABCB|nr:subtilisin-like protease 1, putative [Babesia caballi]
MQTEMQSGNPRDNVPLDVTRLEHLKTFILEPAAGSTPEQLDDIRNFLKAKGARVENDDIATLSFIDEATRTVVTAGSHKADRSTSDDSTSKSKDATGGASGGEESTDAVDAVPTAAPEQWYMDALRIPETWDRLRSLKNRPVKVCVVDTGIDYRNEALKDAFDDLPAANGGSTVHGGNAWRERKYGHNFVDDNTNPLDLHGHGTAVANIIAGKPTRAGGMPGINPHARLIACKAFDNNLKARLSNILSCIDYCIERGAHIQNHGWNISSNSDALVNAFRVADEKGVLMVVSTGIVTPEGRPQALLRPMDTVPASFISLYRNLLTVAGMQLVPREKMQRRVSRCERTRGGQKACLPKLLGLYEIYDKTRYGVNCSHLVAPAKNIFSTGLNNATVSMEGVSLAVGIMSGVSSLLLSAVVNGRYLRPKFIPMLLEVNNKFMVSAKGKVQWEGYTDCYKALKTVLDCKGEWAKISNVIKVRNHAIWERMRQDTPHKRPTAAQ